VSYVPLLGLTDFALTPGAVVFLVMDEETILTVPAGP
jgi:hypothetical protein